MEQQQRRIAGLDEDEIRALSRIADAFVTVLAFAFLGLLILEFTFDPGEAWQRRLEAAGLVIWAVFAADFFVRLGFAQDRLLYLQRNWVAALSVLLPAFRVFRASRALRVFRAARVSRGLRMARLATGTNRATRALRRVLGTGGIGYVLALTTMVLVLSSAGVSALEADASDSQLGQFGAALWWAATTIATLGSEHYPVTFEGRILAVIVMIFGLAVSGYVTAVLAVFLLGQREEPRAKEVRELRDELRQLREEIVAMRSDSKDLV